MPEAPLHRILMVEDDPDIQAVATMALEALGGFSVGVCSSGYEALRRAPIFDPDLILLDMMMPGLDGVGTLDGLRALDAVRHVPVVFLTARVQPHEIEAYEALGAAGVLRKPFDPLTLSASVVQIWEACHG